MPDNPVPGTPSVPEIQARLHAVAQLLREPRPLDSSARQALAELVDELSAALRSAQVPPAEVAQLAEATAQLAESLRQPHDRRRAETVRGRFEEAVLEAEVRHPYTAGLAQRLLDALANLGI